MKNSEIKQILKYFKKSIKVRPCLQDFLTLSDYMFLWL